MPARPAGEAGARAGRSRAARRLRRARAVLRLHERRLVAILLAAGIVLIALHWA